MSITKTSHALYDLENALYNCWVVLEDLRRKDLTLDQVGIITEYMDIKFNQLEEAFLMVHRYNTDAARRYLNNNTASDDPDDNKKE